MTPRITIIATGVANTASIAAAFRRIGADVVIADDPASIAAADHVVLPGVGSFGAGMARLRERGLDDAITAHIEAAQPTLAVCLGLQLLCAGSEESPGTSGLRIIDAPITRFRGDVRVPHFGWNRVEAGPGAALLTTGDAYYANSYRLGETPTGWTAAMTVHGEPFIAALERGPILACQFHPELSGTWGQALLARWLETGQECQPC